MDNVKVFNDLSNSDLIHFYKTSYACVMPSHGGPSNLPLYECFYFRLPMFYNSNLIFNDEIKNSVIDINIDDPRDFFTKLTSLDLEQIREKITNASAYYDKYLLPDYFITKYRNAIAEFNKVLKNWEN